MIEARDNQNSGQEGSTSRTLIDRLKNDEKPAWRELVELYSPLITYWCRRQGLSDPDCSDVTQEVFRSVISSIARFEKQEDHHTFRGWLRTVTRNKILDFFRRKKHRITAIGGSEANGHLAQTPDVDDHLTVDEEELRQQHALFMRAITLIRNDFTTQTWTAFWEVVVTGSATGDVARQLNMSSGAVRVAKSRVLKRLREQLGDVL